MGLGDGADDGGLGGRDSGKLGRSEDGSELEQGRRRAGKWKERRRARKQSRRRGW
jgi:hypothetical protein